MSELKVNKVTPSTGSQVELEATTVFVDGTLRAATVNAPSGVSVQFNGSTKLATSNTGVTVTGTVAATAFSGDGSALTGIVSAGTGGASSTGALSIISDSDNTNGAGEDIVFITGTGNERGRIYRSSGDVRFDTNTLCVDAANNRVGVRTASPAFDLDVNGTVNATSVVAGTLTATTFTPTSLSAGTITTSGTATLQNISSAGTSNLTTVNASGDVNLDAGTLFVKAADNRVGILTTAPQQALDVRGTVQVTDGTSGVQILNGSSLGIVGTSTNHPLVVRTNGTERFRVPSGASGITFPSSPTLSTDANTLDAYLEGTHTVANADIRGTTTAGSRTLSQNTITYTRIGNRVMFSGRITVATAPVTGAGNAQIISLPITATEEGWAPCYFASLTTTTAVRVMAQWTGTTINFFYIATASAAGMIALPIGALGLNADLRFSGSFRI